MEIPRLRGFVFTTAPSRCARDMCRVLLTWRYLLLLGCAVKLGELLEPWELCTIVRAKRAIECGLTIVAIFTALL